MKHIKLFLIIFTLLPSALQAQNAQSGLAFKPDIKLNEAMIKKTLMHYTQPPVLARASQKCRELSMEECFFLYKPFENEANSALASQANLELAFISLQLARPKDALFYIDAAALRAPGDAFISLSKGWVYFSAGKYKQAADIFSKLTFLTANFEYVSSARLGLALSKFYLKDKQQAMEDFLYIYSTYPFMISFASEMLGRVTYEHGGKEKLHAVGIFEEQALGHDIKNISALQLLALAYEEQNIPVTALQYYAMLYTMDRSDIATKKKIDKLSKQFPLINKYISYAKFNEPILETYKPAPPSTQMRIALYADAGQNIAPVQEFDIMSNGRFTVGGGESTSAFTNAPLALKKVVYNKDTQSVVVKDSWGNIDFASQKPFLIQSAANNTLLIKNVSAPDIFFTDFSDKEIKGNLLVAPEEDGLLLVNLVPVEDALPSLLYSTAQNMAGAEALKALAITARSFIYNLLKTPESDWYDFTDNHPNIKFSGVNMESPALQAAVESTRSMVLSNAQAAFYQNCAPVSENKALNSLEDIHFSYSPANVFKYMLSNPTETLLSAPSDDTMWSAVKWIYKYDVKDIERRANAIAPVGKINAVTPLKMSPKGRTLALKIDGSKGSLELDEEEMLQVLGARTTRSNFFFIIPLYNGTKLKELLVFGADTGAGRGLCVAAGAGLEERAYKYPAILNYFFPGERIIYK